MLRPTGHRCIRVSLFGFHLVSGHSTSGLELVNATSTKSNSARAGWIWWRRFELLTCPPWRPLSQLSFYDQPLDFLTTTPSLQVVFPSPGLVILRVEHLKWPAGSYRKRHAPCCARPSFWSDHSSTRGRAGHFLN